MDDKKLTAQELKMQELKERLDKICSDDFVPSVQVKPKKDIGKMIEFYKKKIPIEIRKKKDAEYPEMAIPKEILSASYTNELFMKFKKEMEAYKSMEYNTVNAEKINSKTSISRRKSAGVVAESMKVLKRNRNIFSFVPDVRDREWIRFNLMETLKGMSYDIVISEFKFAGCIADIFGVIENRAVEFEIKMSRNDLINDFKKRFAIGGTTPFKHDYLAAGKSMVGKFYFVVPEGLIYLDECPDHCGLISFDITLSNGWLFKLIKPAPMLHKKFLSGGTWSTIAKRLSIKCNALSLRFAKNDFIAVRRLGIWQQKP